MILETFIRVFVDAEALDRTVDFYAGLLSGKETLRFAYPEANLELAAVSSEKLSVLIIAGPPEGRARFEATRLTIQVDRLEAYVDQLVKAGATQLEPIQATPRGRKTRLRHADGLIVEYVEHDAGGWGPRDNPQTSARSLRSSAAGSNSVMTVPTRRYPDAS